MGADDHCLHVADVDIAAGDGQSWECISETGHTIESVGSGHTEVGILLDIAQLLEMNSVCRRSLQAAPWSRSFVVADCNPAALPWQQTYLRYSDD